MQSDFKSPSAPPSETAILGITRPDKALWTYYLLSCVAVLPLLPLLILPAWFRYQTMRYKFTDEGISMSWGILFRREIIVNYARIQDIHLRSNLVERWLGLAKVLIQTASGSASAEMTLEGLKEFEAVRDFLYLKMRGVKDHPVNSHAPALTAAGATAHDAELATTLQEIARELREVRLLLATKKSSDRGSSPDV